MSKVRSVEELQAALDEELSWRKQELSYISRQVDKSSGRVQAAWCRTGIVMLYAHWEGAVKTCATLYLQHVSEYVARRSLNLHMLRENIRALVGWQALREEGRGAARTSYGDALRIVAAASESRQVRVPWNGMVDTGANLNDDLLRAIVAQVGIDGTAFATKRQLIDERLLRHRNDIAHGGRSGLEPGTFEDYKALEVEILDLLQTFCNLLSNAASTEAFRVWSASAAATLPST